MEWTPQNPRFQEPIPRDPYDRWVSPAGVCMAEFYRHENGYYLRFPGQADFLLAYQQPGSDVLVTGWPTPECDSQTITNLYHNAIQPILGNHSGGLFLHGSAVKLNNGEGAIAFLGLSRGGKTTLAGSFASAGHPFLTEDVIDLAKRDRQYWLQPKRSKLRLFIDSARHLMGSAPDFVDENRKQDVESGDTLPFSDEAAPLRQIYVLGTDHSSPLSIRQFSQQEALSALMPNAFILDVEDKERLRSHFARMAGLAQDIGCYALDYTRDYAELPRVKSAILDNFHAG